MLPTYKICLNTCQSYWVKSRFEFVLYTLICTFISLKILNFPLFTWSLLQSDVKKESILFSFFYCCSIREGKFNHFKIVCLCCQTKSFEWKFEIWVPVHILVLCLQSLQIDFFFPLKNLMFQFQWRDNRPGIISVIVKIVSDIV